MDCGYITGSVALGLWLCVSALSVTTHLGGRAPCECDADGDGRISPEDWDVSMTKLTTSLGIDTHEFDDITAQHRNGGELGAMGRNEAAAHRDGLAA